ncbi:phage tail protein [Rheinheimera soli]|uniref:phage tail protein n=1 Tax=Rheinheimera soli TaxID=443616 RepID=UPI001E56646F|nr:tail fiber protein [Rheinheimera soli]
MSEPFIGEIRSVGFSYAPRGWAFCDGRLLAIAQYSALFSLLGTTYGGDGQTTFALPDLRGRVPTGQGQGPGLPVTSLGQKAGTPSTTLTVAQLPQHIPQATFQGTAASGTVSLPVGTSSASPIAQPTADGTSYLTATTVTSGRDPLTVNGLYTNTAPTSPAHLGGGTTSVVATGTVTVAPVGGSQPFSITQPYLGVNFIIALQGIFPSRN